MVDRQHPERLAGEYSALRGLFMLPVSGLLIASALANDSWGPFARAATVYATIVLAGLAALGIDRYYRRTFGRVRMPFAQQLRALAVGLFALPGFLGLALVLRSRASWSLDLPVNAIAICFAVLLAASYLVTVRLRTEHLLVLGPLFIAGAAPVWTGGDPSNVGMVMTAVAMACLGLLDHRYLVHRLSPPPPPTPSAMPHAGGAR
jgi:hypothetical protein